MTLRLLRILVGGEHRERAEAILEEHGAAPRWHMPMQDGGVTIEVLLRAAGNEPILDDLQNAFRHTDGFRLIFFPVQATVPRMPEPDEEEDPEQGGVGDSAEGASWGAQEEGSPARVGVPGGSGTELAAPAATERPAPAKPRDVEGGDPEEEEEEERKAAQRINREELYASLAASSDATSYYVSMVALSSIVACAGLLLGDGAVIIGAMVIAPLIGPSIALSFATTLGDLELGRRALGASFIGMMVAFGVALAIGFLVEVDPTGSEIVGRTRLTFEHLALALAAGAAGAIATSKGVGTGLVGVMVAVALLPPLANGALLLGGGYVQLGLGAFMLVFANVVCVNLAATATFLVQGVRPNSWWEEDTRNRAVWTASILWGLLLLALFAVVWLGWGGEVPG